MSFGNRSTLLILLVLLSITTIFTKLEIGNLPSYDDAYYAQKAREILKSGDIWTMTIEGRPRFDNPPGFIWLEAIAFKLFGVNEFAARWPSAVGGMLGILGTFFLFELLFSTRVGFLAALILNLTTVYLKYSRHSMMDTTVAASGVWCFYFFFKGLRGTSKWYLVSGLVGSYVMFAKSAFGALPPLVLLFYLLATRQLAPFKKLAFWGGVILLALPYGVWCWIEYLRVGDVFIQGHFVHLLLTKAVTRGENDHFYDYGIVLLKYFPLFLPFMGMGIWSAFKARGQEARAQWFGLVFFLTYFIFLSAQSTTKTWYFIPAFPACAGLAAVGLERWVTYRYSLDQLGKFIAGLVLAVFVVTHMTPAMNSNERAVEIRRLSPYVRAAGVAGYTLLGYEIDYYGLNSALLFYSDFAAKNVNEEGLKTALASGGKVAVVLNPKGWAQVRDVHPELKVIRKTEKLIFVGNAPLEQEEVF